LGSSEIMRKLCRLTSFTLAVVISFTVAGCSESGGIEGTAPVKGKVTYNNAPVEGASVSFIGGETQRPAGAITSADGSYELMTGDTPGALPGQYSVLVTKGDAPALGEMSMEDASKLPPSAPPKQLLPAKYGDPLLTPLKYEVKAGSNTIDLQLTD
jgi:hypothetical protein